MSGSLQTGFTGELCPQALLALGTSWWGEGHLFEEMVALPEHEECPWFLVIINVLHSIHSVRILQCYS